MVDQAEVVEREEECDSRSNRIHRRHSEQVWVNDVVAYRAQAIRHPRELGTLKEMAAGLCTKRSVAINTEMSI